MVSYDLTEAQLRDGYDACIKNAQNLLFSAKLLLTSENSLQYALGLYMYAIEEYGKAEILKEYMQENKNQYSIPGWIFGIGESGRDAHNKKLAKGLQKLPPVCSKLSPTAEMTTNTTKSTQTIVLKKNGIPVGSVSIGGFSTGIFEDTTHIASQKVQLSLKTSCFYIDWNSTNCDWEFFLPTDRDQLTYIIERMKKQLESEKAKEDNFP
jgi:AbiV family abortive infection protein